MLKMPRNFIRLMVLAGLVTLTVDAHATAFQSFAGIAYSNAAALNNVKNLEFILGNTQFYTKLRFNGEAGGVSGSAQSFTVDSLPYGRIAYRYSPNVVLGLDIAQVANADIQYPTDSIIRYAGTRALVRATDYTPKLSYKWSDSLALGIGLDIYHFWGSDLAFVAEPYGLLSNPVSNWKLGWDVGLSYVATPCTFLNFFYYSKVVNHQTGTSKWGPLRNNDLKVTLPFPDTWVFNVVQLLTPQWALSGTVRWEGWSANQYLVFQNTVVGTITIPDRYKNGWNFQLATRYQFNENFAGFVAGEYDTNIQDTRYVQVGYPLADLSFVAIGGEFTITKELKAKLTYGNAFSRPRINMTAPIPVIGHVKVNAHMLDFNLTYDM